MCRFFPPKKIVKGIGIVSILVPLAVLITSFSTDDIKSGAICSAWLINSFVAIGVGYYIGSSRKCMLPHIAENVIIEQEDRPQIEGDQREDVEMVAPAEVLPQYNR